MKTLYLMRHAKSSWKDLHLTDHERPLNHRGKKAAPEMAGRLKDKGVILDGIISSDAKRAAATAAAVAKTLGMPSGAVTYCDELYHASPEQILGIVRELEDDWDRAMVVGHNPGITELARRFYPAPIVNVPTAGIVELVFEAASWRDIDPRCLASASFDFPKNKLSP